MADLYVAAGGGGDALAASIIHRALGGRDPAVIATYAWERLAVDPVPGPRGADDFVGLERLGQGTYAITPTTTPKTPSGSTLPRLAAEIGDGLVLLDPTHGAVGMQGQLNELIDLYQPTHVHLVDVGGDALATGDEPGLRSPLADALALAACARIRVQTHLLVAGPGLDGELSETDVLKRVDQNVGLRLVGGHVTKFEAVFDWHPSEATALLAAAARGVRGRVEIRDSGLLVELTDRSADVHFVSLDAALTANAVASSLVGSRSLAEAERITRQVCGFSEIDYEREKAVRLKGADSSSDVKGLDTRIEAFEREAASRRIDFVTFRRLAEALSLAPGLIGELRRHLIETCPAKHVWPLWAIDLNISIDTVDDRA